MRNIFNSKWYVTRHILRAVLSRRRCLSPDQHILTQTQHSSGQLASHIPFPKFEPARKSFQGK